MPKIDALTKMTLTLKDPWFKSGIRLESLSQLHSALVEVKKWIPSGTVYRGFSNLYAQMMAPPSRSHIHHQERRESRSKRL